MVVVKELNTTYNVMGTQSILGFLYFNKLKFLNSNPGCFGVSLPKVRDEDFGESRDAFPNPISTA